MKYKMNKSMFMGIHFKQICRLCLSEGATNNIFLYSSELGGRIADIIIRCAPVNIITKYDKLPDSICKACYVQISTIQKFQTLALKSEMLLHDYLEQLTTDKRLDLETFVLESSKIDNNLKNRAGSLSENELSSEKSVLETSEFSEVKTNRLNSNIVCVKYETAKNGDTEIINWNDSNHGDDSDVRKSGDNDFISFDFEDKPNICIFKEASNAIPRKKIDTRMKMIQKTYESANKVKSSKSKNSPEISPDKNVRSLAILNVTSPTTKFTKVHRCNVCNKHFTRLANLKIHKRKHSGEKPYQCDICDKTFSHTNTLKLHKLMHTGEKPYLCDVCSKSFTDSSNLNRHKLKHTGEKPHRCEACSKRFTTSTGLNRHKLLHTGEKPFECDVCYKRFNKSANLCAHKLLHSGEKPHKCDVCNKCFTRFTHMVRHKRVHTGEKPYQCDTCDKTFSHADSLKIHKLSHTGEKPFLCDICCKSFTNASNLNRHKIQHIHGK